MSIPTKNGNSFLAPPSTNNMSLPQPPAQTLKTTGSATGNPRNKCALKPGHSLMDWIRLGNSGVDLAGTRGRVVPVSIEELAKHNKQNDAWMSIRGKVFNVTRYMDFHPGGVDELMRGVGRDATKLFDEVHAWVNYQQLLAKCYIGPLKHVVKLDTDLLKALKTKTTNDFNSLPPVPSDKPKEVTPRFDWIQKRADITFCIYTGQFCNPGLVLQMKHEKHLVLRVLIAHAQHEYSLELQHAVKWPPKMVHIASESGKIELIFNKSAEELWATYGSYTSTQSLANEILIDELRYEQKIMAKSDFNHDSFDMVLGHGKDKLIIRPPIGHHLSIVTNVNAGEVTRSYTPVSAKYLQSLSQTPEESIPTLCFLIKSYEHGLLSTHLQQLETGATLQITAPRGNFNWGSLTQHKQILLLAAGSGITPMLSVIEPLLKRATNRLQNLVLLYFNKTEADIWCRKQLDELSEADERFNVQYILSQADGSAWTGLCGRLNKDLLSAHIAPKQQPSNLASYVLICGPNAFNQLALQLLNELNFTPDCVHVFQ